MIELLETAIKRYGLFPCRLSCEDDARDKTARSMNSNYSPMSLASWHLDHINVSMGSDKALCALFEEVMGLAPGPRPTLPLPGKWLYQGERALVHAVNDPTLSATTGELRLGHVAFRGDEPASHVIGRLQSSGLVFKVSSMSEDHRVQIFVLLPGGLVIEMNVPSDVRGGHSHPHWSRSTRFLML